jgi:energy-coupling factor transporter ATP-binding protein EcfA2
MITDFLVEGFKSLDRESIQLGRVNCLIGANGSGKSNIIEALGVLGAAASGTVDATSLFRRGVRPGTPRLYKSSFKTERARPAISMEARSLDGALYRASLLNPLEEPKPAWSFKTETLTEGEIDVFSRGVRTTNGNLSSEAGYAALKAVELEPDSPAARILTALQNYRIYSPNTPALRSTVPDTQMQEPVGLAGGGLADAVSVLVKHGGDAVIDAFEEALDLIDWIEDVAVTESPGGISSSAVPRGKFSLKFTDRFMRTSRNVLTGYEASEGALYVLFYAVLCLSPYSPSIIAVDNLDQAINPRLIQRVVSRLPRWLNASGIDRQLIFTAHNPAVLDGLDLADDAVRLFAVDRDNTGQTTIRRIIPTPEIQELNKEYPLSRLWMTGHLGAVPDV